MEPLAANELLAALYVVRDLLGADACRHRDGRYHFALAAGTLALSADSARRLRIDRCVGGVPRVSFWSAPDDRARLERLVGELARHAPV